MHTGNLILEHALGIRTRSANNQITDSFECGKNLCIKVHKNLMVIMSKRNKNVFDAYKVSCKKHFNADCNRFVIPNKTRISGKI
jgi:hypothetical protein